MPSEYSGASCDLTVESMKFVVHIEAPGALRSPNNIRLNW